MDRKLGGLIVLLTLASPVSAKDEPLMRQTPSGKAETIIEGWSLEAVKNELVNGCMSNGMQIEVTQFTVICSRETPGGRGFAAGMLLGNRFSGKPHDKVRFNLAARQNGVYVTAESYMEMTMGFGEVKRVPYTSNRERNTLQRGLDQAAANAKAAPAPPQDQTQPAAQNSEMEWRHRGW